MTLPDRFRHNAILASTAPLPSTLRIKSRSRLLADFQVIKAKRADILIIVHPKAGGTWFRVMLSHIYQSRYGLPPERIVKSDEFQRRNAALPRFLITNGQYTYEGAVQRLFDNPSRTLSGKKVIFLARHPCDIAISWYLQFAKRTKAYKRELINHTLQQPVDPATIDRWAFIMHPELGLPALIEYLNTWQQRIAGLDNGLLIRYEDLRSAPFATLKRAIRFLDEPCDDHTIQEAVEFASFDNLGRLEKSNFFHNAGLKLRNTRDPDTLKVRRGKVGGYRQDFSAEQAAEMEALVRARLAPELGYIEPDAQTAHGAFV